MELYLQVVLREFVVDKDQKPSTRVQDSIALIAVILKS